MSNSTQNNVSWINANFCLPVLSSVLQNLPDLNVITILPIPFGFVIFPGLYFCFEISPPPYPTHTLQRIFSFYTLRSDGLFVPNNTVARTVADLKVVDREKNVIWLVVSLYSFEQETTALSCLSTLTSTRPATVALFNFTLFCTGYVPAFDFRPRDWLFWAWRFCYISVPEDIRRAVVNPSIYVIYSYFPIPHSFTIMVSVSSHARHCFPLC